MATFEEWWKKTKGDRMRQSKYLAKAVWQARGEQDAKLAEAEACEYEDSSVIVALNSVAAKLRSTP